MRSRLVIVEDDDDTRSCLVDIFETDGRDVKVAGDPEGAHVAIRGAIAATRKVA